MIVPAVASASLKAVPIHLVYPSHIPASRYSIVVVIALVACIPK
jgi:hypothetical protein